MSFPKSSLYYYIHTLLHQRLTFRDESASPLNGEAAELWDKDPAEFKKKVLARHRDIDDE